MGRSPFCDKKGFKKGPWITEEDDKLIQYIHTHGPGNWRALPKFAGLQRCGKSCRLRWTNYLRPDIKRGRFSFEEEECIIQLHSILGNKWSAIAARLPGRTDNEIKNYWNTHIRKRLLRNGIDPVTHSPRLDLFDLSSILFGSNQLNLSSLLGPDQTFLNTDQARVFATLLASNHQNLNTLSQKLIQNQLTMICEMQNESLLNFQPNTSSSFPRAQIINHTQGMESMSCQSYQQNLDTSYLDGSFGILPNNISNVSDQIKLDFSEISNLSRNSSQVMTSQNVMFESPLSTPMRSLSSLQPSSTYINNNSTIEDEWENYQRDIFKFEIPESLNMDDFL